MNSKGTAKRKKTVFFLKTEELCRSAEWRTKLLALFLRISLPVPFITKVIKLERPLGRIALARKRIVNRFYYPCKFALFRLSSAFWLQGS